MTSTTGPAELQPPRPHDRSANPAPDQAEPDAHPGPTGWFADTVERLFHDFDGHLPLTVIVTVTRHCREQLKNSGLPPAALPELVERLARQRLARHPRRASARIRPATPAGSDLLPESIGARGPYRGRGGGCSPLLG